MTKRLLGLFLLITIIALLGACGEKKETESTESPKVIKQQAEKLVKDKLLSSYKEMGLDIEKYEISNIKLAAQVPYGKGGTFDYYSVQIRLKPRHPEQTKKIEKRDQIKITSDNEGWIVKNSGIGDIFISAFHEGKELYEFLWLREKELPRDKKGKLDFRGFTKYRYGQISPVKVEEEYTFLINGTKISIGQNDKGKLPLTDAKITKRDPGDLMRGATSCRKIWKSKEICAETYTYFEKHYEPVLRMATTDPQVKTNRGIGVGNTAEELFKAYGIDNLVFSSKNFGGEWFNSFAEEQKLLKDNDNWTCFGFTGKDTTQNYIAFYMKEGKVTAIEMGTGFDYKPFEKKEIQYPLEVEPLINDHIDEPSVMKYDVELPKVKSSVNGSDNLNALIQLDFQKIIEYSQKGKYEPDVNNYSYPWVEINYSVSNLNGVAVLNIFTKYSSAAGSGSSSEVKSYYYDTTCGARLSEEAALFKMGYSKENIIKYFKFFWPEDYKDYGDESQFYFDKTGEPVFVIYQSV
ncbi:outer membrane protein assembly factor BamD [Aminipila terrae]|uniref:Uncharacterized protein n=1 Tax=Aminipila terrae TaxID=2697030 RepID=A0A6P1M9A8_9FIRM|nr:hypothetical protein [Aminipila terrae]QHI71200.1 hypothetical protein Ami3637_01250 [Aminipila terrae]